MNAYKGTNYHREDNNHNNNNRNCYYRSNLPVHIDQQEQTKQISWCLEHDSKVISKQTRSIEDWTGQLELSSGGGGSDSRLLYLDCPLVFQIYRDWYGGIK